MTFRMATDVAPPAPPPCDGSGFRRHGIAHLSASSLNLWVNAPDLWVAKYLHGHAQRFGPAPRRGQCVESGIVAALGGTSVESATRDAVQAFDADFPDGDEAVKERALIPDMIAQGVRELAPYGAPEFAGAGQDKVVIRAAFDGWSIPLIGYLDLVFPDHGLVIDLKTTTRVPSVMSAEHQLQRAIYQAASGNRAVRFLYLSGRKSAMLEDGHPPTILAAAKVQIARLDRFLAIVDRNQALAIVPHNPGSFYWRGDDAGRSRLFGT